MPPRSHHARTHGGIQSTGTSPSVSEPQHSFKTDSDIPVKGGKSAGSGSLSTVTPLQHVPLHHSADAAGMMSLLTSMVQPPKIPRPESSALRPPPSTRVYRLIVVSSQGSICINITRLERVFDIHLALRCDYLHSRWWGRASRTDRPRGCCPQKVCGEYPPKFNPMSALRSVAYTERPTISIRQPNMANRLNIHI